MADTLAAPCHSDIVIRKSRFIGCVEPMADRQAAVQRVAQLRAAHMGAAHVCWALLAGGHSAAVDDGEPGGTAGRPMLDVLRYQNLEQVLATVVRYYGGIKLGAGGLVRAYGDSVAQALRGAQRVALEVTLGLGCVLPYALEGTVRRLLEQAGATLLDVRHAEQVVLSFRVCASLAPDLQQRLNDAGRGQLLWLDTLS